MSRENAEGAETRKYFNAGIAEIAETEPAGRAKRGDEGAPTRAQEPAYVTEALALLSRLPLVAGLPAGHAGIGERNALWPLCSLR